jgi:hypothetical protein
MSFGVYCKEIYWEDMAIVSLYVDLWKEKKNGSNKSEFVVREGDLEYESSIYCMVA